MCTHRRKEYAVHCSQLELLLDLQCGDEEPTSCMSANNSTVRCMLCQAASRPASYGSLAAGIVPK